MIEDEIVLKNLTYIAFVFVLGLSLDLSASEKPKGPTGEEKKCDKKQEEGTVNNQPSTSNAELFLYDEGFFKSESVEMPSFNNYQKKETVQPLKIDSTNNSSSISKYNYLFYFIYKYKFENRFGLDQIEKMITD